MNKYPISATWRSPSNIAIVKYWGKKGNQIPANPSISMTLKKSVTETTTSLIAQASQTDVSFELFFNGEKNVKFEQKIRPFLEMSADFFPFIKTHHLIIETTNTFPHSAGIASSASGMSALALTLRDLNRQFDEAVISEDEFMLGASFLSRLGSGSACRSVYGDWVLWGKTENILGSSDDYAIPLPISVGNDFTQLHDSILIVSAKEKGVSSRAGHGLMDTHPYAEARYKQANENVHGLIDALHSNDWERFVQITENEALSLHALMMNSNPWFILLQPNSINILNRIRDFREKEKVRICFTIDAGPNIHVLYPQSEVDVVKSFIKTELSQYLENDQWIDDMIGSGPEKLKTSKK